MIREHLPRAVENGEDIVARGQMLIAACMAGAAFSNAQVGMVHALAHSVGAKFGVPHGIANSILLPHCILYNRIRSISQRTFCPTQCRESAQQNKCQSLVFLFLMLPFWTP